MDEMMGSYLVAEAWNASIKIVCRENSFPEFEPKSLKLTEEFLYNQVLVSHVSLFR